MAIDTESRFFLIKFRDPDGDYYLLCQSLLAVREDALGGAAEAVASEFARGAETAPRAEICELPQPGETRGWTALQAKIQVKPGPVGGG